MFNRMVERSSNDPDLDTIFGTLADPIRRALIEHWPSA